MGIKISNINHKTSSTFCLQDINLSLENGTLGLIIGPNGSGKSTLLKIAAGLVKPDSGSVEISGQNIASIPPKDLSKLISYLPPESSVMFDYTCEDIVMLGRYPHHKGLISAVDRKIVTETLETLDIRHLASQIADQVSSGEFKKVMIARCLALQPKIMVLDEPCSSLDLSASFNLMTLLQKLCRDGIGVLLSIHDIHLGRKFGDQCLAMKAGEEYLAGSVDSVLTKKNIAELFNVSEQILS